MRMARGRPGNSSGRMIIVGKEVCHTERLPFCFLSVGRCHLDEEV